MADAAVLGPTPTDGAAEFRPSLRKIETTQSAVPSDSTDDDNLYADQDGAQSFIQPAISPIATRLTSPSTPAAEKAAAMDRLVGGGLFDVPDEPESPPSPTIQMPDPAPLLSSSSASPNTQWTRTRGMTVGDLPPPHPHAPALPSPWQTGPKSLVLAEPLATKPAMLSVFGSQSRHRRSSSGGDSALKRLSKALPSISIPTGFIPNIPTPSFFSSSSSNREYPIAQSPKHSPVGSSAPTSNSVALVVGQTAAAAMTGFRPNPSRPQSVASKQSHLLRKSTSDDSLLYHSLSRVSSFGDDERFTHIREQVNSRFKAIKDSWDGPSFKLPQLPNILQAPLKKGPASPPASSTDLSRSGSLSRAARDGMSTLDAVIENLTGDVVVMGGYRGSILRSSQPPYRQLWVPVKVGLNIRKVNMEVGLDPEDELNMEDHIFASGMLQNIGPVDISRRLFKKLRESGNARKGKLRVHDYGYDWRLSPHLLSRKLVEFLEKLPSNHPDTPREQRGALVIAHSLGGLITRHAVNQRPELFSGVLYAGVPQRCINILGPLRNGDAVLLNEKVLTAHVNFSLRTTFVFLPEDGFCFIDKHTKEEYPIDFYNADDWVKYRLCPSVSEPALPPLMTRNSALSSLLNLPDTLTNRSRSNSNAKRTISPSQSFTAMDVQNRIGMAPQMSSPSMGNQHSAERRNSSPPRASPSAQAETFARNLAYLRRTLAEIKQFRAELAHNPTHQDANVYPPLSVMYGKDIPTVYAARVASQEGIPCADAYDDLVFRSGDGVVLARESMLPAGYELVRGGRVCTDRGHVTMLGDLPAVGRALEAIVRGRKKGIGMGAQAGKHRERS